MGGRAWTLGHRSLDARIRRRTPGVIRTCEPGNTDRPAAMDDYPLARRISRNPASNEGAGSGLDGAGYLVFQWRTVSTAAWRSSDAAGATRGDCQEDRGRNRPWHRRAPL